MAGLSCAVRLHEAGRRVALVDAASEPGGRIRTDNIGGFRLDRGFQVYLTAYPRASRLLDMKRLQLGRFEPGAMVWTGTALVEVSDPLRRPLTIPATLLSPVGSFADKLRIAALKFSLTRKTHGRIFSETDLETRHFWSSRHFSKTFQDGFLRPFFGGIFLEEEMKTSSRMFAYVFKQFSRGYAALPAGGMQSIPDQLASRLPAQHRFMSTRVVNVTRDCVHLENGRPLTAGAVVLATDMSAAAELLESIQTRPWNSTRCLYFSADRSPLPRPLIALNGSGKGCISNVSVPSDVAPGYAPEGKSLVCVSLRNGDTGSPEDVLEELRQWFKSPLTHWEHLHTYHIPRALPRQQPGDNPAGKAPARLPEGIFLAGDYRYSASIEGAVRSGEAAANAVIAST